VVVKIFGKFAGVWIRGLSRTMALSSYVKPPPTALAYVRTQARRRTAA